MLTATRTVLVGLLLVSAAACGQPTSGSAVPAPPSSQGAEAPAEGTISWPDEPPLVTVHAGDESIELAAWTYCYGNGCVDGPAPADPPDIGGPAEVRVDFPLKGWTFEASFTPAGHAACGRVQSVPLRPTGDGTFLLEPVGYAATYDVTLFGRGSGDLIVTFRWTTPKDGELDVPRASLAVLADHDGEVDSYGVELAVLGLAQNPTTAIALVTVTSADGRSLEFEAEHEETFSGCQQDGSISWDGPDARGLAATRLGPAPFTYDVVLTLDGAEHVATATWPDDQIEGNEPSVALDFTPALRRLVARGG